MNKSFDFNNQLFQNLGYCFWNYNQENDIIQLSNQFVAIEELKDLEINLNTWLNLIHENNQQEIKNSIANNNKFLSNEIIFQLKDYKYNGRWFCFKINTSHENAQNLTHGIIYEVTSWKNREDKIRNSDERFSLAVNKLTENALQKSEDKYGKLVNSLPDMVLVHIGGIVVYSNLAFCQVTGYTSNEIINQNISMFLEEDEQITVNNMVRRRENKETNLPIYTIKIKIKNGSYRTVDVRGGIIDYENKPAHLAVLTDVTEKREIQEELRKKELYFRNLFDNSPEGIVILNNNDEIIDSNNEFLRIFRFTQNEILNRKINELIVPDFLINEASDLSNQVFKNKIIEKETFRKTKDEKIVPVSILGSPIIIDQNQVGVYGIYRDVSKQRAAEEALKESQTLFQTLTQVSPVGIFRTTADGYTNYVNPKWSELSGLSYEDALGNGWLNAVHPDDRERIQKNWDKDSSNNSSSNAEYRFLKPDGSIVWVIGNAVPEMKDNEIKGYIGTITDITEQKIKERNLFEKEEQYRTLFESSSDANIIIEDDIFSHCNQKTLDMFACKFKEEIIGKSPVEFSPDFQPDGESSLLKSRQYIANAYAGKPQNFEWKHRRLDDTLFDAEVSLSKFEFQNKVYLQVTVKDITEKKQALELIKHRQTEIEALLNNIPAYVFFKNTRSQYIAANVNFCRELHTTPNDIIGKTDYDFIPIEKAKKFEEEDTQIIKTGEPIDFGEQRLDFDNNTQYVWNRKVPYKNKIGKVLGIIGISFDITERKEAELALQKSEEKFRTLIENQGEGLIIVDNEEKFIFSNPAADELFGVEKNELIGKSLFEFLDESQISIINNETEKRKHGLKSSYELEIKTKNNERKNILVTANPNFNEQGEFVSSFAIFRDITQSKQAEKIQSVLHQISETSYNVTSISELFNSIHKILNQLINTKNFYISLFDPIREIVSFPYYIDEFDAQPEPRKYKKGLTEYVYNTGKPLLATQKEFDELTKSGDIIREGAASKYWLGVPLVTNNHIIGVIVMQSYDDNLKLTNKEKDILIFISEQIAMVIERKKAEENLKESEERFRELFENANDIVITNDLNGAITSMNKSAEVVLGYSNIDGLNIKDIFTNDGFEIANQMNLKKMLGETDKTIFEADLITKAGKDVHVEINSRLIYKDDSPIGIHIIARDITERKKARIAIQKLNNDLIDKNQELEQIVYITSHDLRSPLVNIHGFSIELNNLIKDIEPIVNREDYPAEIRTKLQTALQEEAVDYLGYILKSTTKMDLLLKALLKYSRMGRAELNIVHLNMTNIFADILKTLEYQIQTNNVKIYLSELSMCLGDETQVNQIFTNLIDNALKYSDKNKEQPYIKISSEVKENMAIYCIEDNGIGIPEKHLQKVFELFHRIDPGKIVGDGIGLTTVKKIVNRHNGQIWLESQEKQGSKFYVSLPIAPL